MNIHGKMNYVEFPSGDLVKTKQFFKNAFGWNFTDYGPEYTAFADEGLDGGFYLSNVISSTEKGAALIVFYSNQLEETALLIKNAGGVISKDIFDFPGGRRFHFTDPHGNEYAVWSDIAV
jgi:predicted enzyme related to lactoylglutathione lyase